MEIKQQTLKKGISLVYFVTIAIIVFFVMSCGKKNDKKANSNEELADTEQSYKSCPDSDHPHIIDLGLPSGTKWACCNVEASVPEEFGGSYAWGEASNESVDKWGASWQMPTLEQCQELIDNCSSEWTTRNGVDGRVFTGPNGGTIFLPAAGVDNSGLDGYYWSSTPMSSDFAYWLGFSKEEVFCDMVSSNTCLSVRPVCED